MTIQMKAVSQANSFANNAASMQHVCWPSLFICTSISPPTPYAGEEKEIVVDKDDGIRPDISVATLGALKPVFKKGGTTTAGNSSQVGPQSLCCP